MKNSNPTQTQLRQQRNCRTLIFKVLILLATSLAIQPLHAATLTWTNITTGGVASGSWAKTNSWNPNGVPGAADTADFSTLNITADSTVTLDTNANITSLIFGDTITSSAAGWIVNVGTPSTSVLTNAGVPTTTITVNALATGNPIKAATINAVVAGGSLTKAGAGNLGLSAANLYTGGTTNSAGVIVVVGATAGTQTQLGTGPVTFTGGNMSFSPGSSTANIMTTTNSLVINANAIITTADGVRHLNGPISLAANLTVGSAGWIGKGIYLDGIISGNGNLTIKGSGLSLDGSGVATAGQIGIVYLTGNNTFSGITTITSGNTTNSGTLNVANDFNFGTDPGTPTAGQIVILTNGILQAANTMTLSGNRGIAIGPTSGTGIGTIDTPSGTLTYDGVIANNGGTGILIKTGTGTLLLSGANGDSTYTGGTLISAGTLRVGNGSSGGQLGTGNITNNATLVFNAPSLTVANLISGSGPLTVSGGSLVLNAANTYTGLTTVSTGAALQLGVANAIRPGNNVTVNGTGTLDLNGTSPIYGALNGNGTVNDTPGGGTLVLGTNNATGTFSGIINGSSLAVTVISTNTTTLTGANTYSGDTIVTAGKLVITTLHSGGGNFSISNATTLGITVGANNQISPALASLTLGGGGGSNALEFNNVINTTTAGPAPLNVNSLVLNGTVTLNIPTGVFGSQEFPLIQYGSISGSGGFVIGTLPPGVASVQIITNLGTSTIDILPVTDVWTGNVNSNWDNSTVNWAQFGNPVAFTNGLQALFDDSITSNQTNVNLTTSSVAPGGISFNNNTYNYTLNSANGSSLGGGGFVFKVGSGTTTILNSNNFSGGTTRIGGGTLVVANQNAIQGSTLDLNSADLGSISFAGVTTANIGGLQGANNLGLTNASGAALALNVGGAVQNSAGYSGLLSGPGSLAKVGSNTVAIFNGGQTFIGGTVVSNGVLQLGNNNTGPVLPAGLVIASGGTVNNRFSGGTALNQFSGAGTNIFAGALNSSVTLSSVANPGFTGTYEILGGRIQASSVASLGNPSMIYVGGLAPIAGSSTNAQLWANVADIFTQPITITGIGATTDGTPFGAMRLNGGGVTTPVIWAGPITLAGDARINSGNGALITGPVSGNFRLEMGNNGQTLFLQPAALNTYGSTLISGGTVAALNGNAFSTGAMTVNSGTLEFCGNNFTFANLSGNGGIIGNVVGFAPATLTVGTDGSSTGYGGTLADGSSATSGPFAPLSLVKAGAGTLTLTNASIFSGTTRIAGGVLQLGNSLTLQNSIVNLQSGDTGTIDFAALTAATFSGLQGANNLVLQNTAGSGAGVALTVGNTTPANASTSVLAYTYSGVLSGTGGSLIEVGASALTLSGANTYDTGTTISGGTLAVNNTTGSGTGSGTVTVNSGGTLTGSGIISGAVTASSGSIVAPGNLGSTGKLTLNGGLTDSGVMAYNLSAPANAGLIDLASSGAASVGSATVSPNSSSVVNGTYILITNATSVSGTPVAQLPRGLTASFANSTATALVLDITGVAAPGSLVWNGTTTGNWDVNSSLNWSNPPSTTLIGFLHGDAVRFGGGANYTVTLAQNVYPASVAVSNTGNTLTLNGGGQIGGATSLIKTGAGTLSVINTNNYTGGTVIAGGVLQLTGAGGTSTMPSPLALGTGTITITNGGRLHLTSNGGANNGTAYLPNSIFLDNNSTVSRDDSRYHLATAPGATITIGAGGGTFNLTWGGKDTWIDGILQGSGPITIGSFGGDDGTLWLDNAANTYNGTLTLGSAGPKNVGLNVNNALQFARFVDNGGNALSLRFGPGVANPVIGSLEGTAGITLAQYLERSSIVGDPVTLTAGGNGSNTVYSGVMSGLASSFVKAGSGNMTLSAANTYTGPTVISGGTLQIGAGSTAGSIASSFITNNAALVFNRSDAIRYGALITGTGSLTNLGTGTLTLSNANSYAGNTTISAGTVQIGLAGAIPSGAGKGNIVDNGALDLNGISTTINGLTGSGSVTNATASAATFTVGANDQTSSFGGAIKNGNGTIAVTKTGSGTITLAGANTYNGPTTVNGGKLVLTTDHQGGGAVTVINGTSFGASVVNASSIPVSTFTLGGGGTTSEFSGVSSTTVAPVTATNLSVNGTVTINILSGSLGINTYPLIKFTTRTGTGNFVIGSLPVGVSATVVTNGSTIALNVSASLPAIWNGAVNGNWDINTTTNWTFNSAPSVYQDGFTVQFDNTSIQTNVTLTTTVSPGGINVNSTNNYAFNGPGLIVGSGALTKTGSGTLTLTNLANTYSGISTINGGTIFVNADNNLGAASPGNIVVDGGTMSAVGGFTLNSSRTFSLGPVTGAGGGTIDVATNQTLTFGGIVANEGTNGSLTKTGPGTLVLNGANTYSGSTLVSGGILAITTAQQTGGAVTVGDSTTLNVSASGSATLPASSLIFGTSGSTALGLSGVNGTNAPITATNLTANGTLTISVLNGGANFYKLGVSPLIKYSALSGSGTLALGTLPVGISGVLTNDIGAKSINLIVTAIAPIVWTGNNGTAWDINNTVNWQLGGTNLTYQDGEAVQFDDTAPGSATVNLTAIMNPLSIMVTNSTAKNYTFTANAGAKISGGASLTKTGNGTLTLNTLTNDFTGGVTVNNGTLALTSVSAAAFDPRIVGSGTLTVNGGVLQVSPYGSHNNYNITNNLVLNGGTLYTADGNEIFGTSNSTITVNGSATLNRGFGHGWPYDSGGKNMMLDGLLQGSGALTLNGINLGFGEAAGAWVDNNNNTYSGIITVNATSGNGMGLTIGGNTALQYATVNIQGVDGSQIPYGLGFSGITNSVSTLVEEVVNPVVGAIEGNGNIALQTWTGANEGAGASVALTVGGNNASTLFSGVLSGSGSLTKMGGGTLTLSGANTYSGLTIVSNGTLVISTAHAGNGDFVVNDGMTLGVINNGGSQSAMLNNLTLGDTAGPTTLVITNIADPLTPVISAPSVVTLNGNCTITIPTTNSLVAGNVYPLIKYGSLAGGGAFLLSVPGSVTATLTNDTGNAWIALAVTAITPPVNTTPTNITATVSGNTLTLGWPADHTGWRLQTQTNSLSTGLGNLWFDVPGSAVVNSMNFTIDPVNGTVFYRMVYP